MTIAIFNLPIESAVKFISIILITAAQIMYFVKLAKKTEQFKPSVISWLGWALLMGISFYSQLQSKGWTVNLLSLLISTTSCVVISFSAKFIFKHYKIDKKDWNFFYIGLGCVLIFLLSSNEWITTSIAIIADFIFAIPLIKSAIKDPAAEKALLWPIALTAWGFTIVLLTYHFSWIYTLWPIYLILFNGTLTYLTYIKPKLL